MVSSLAGVGAPVLVPDRGDHEGAALGAHRHGGDAEVRGDVGTMEGP